MSDTTVTTEAPMPNSPEARTPTGELKDQAQPTPTTTPTDSTTPEPEPKPEAPAGAPEAYSDFTLPEGVKLEGETLKAATDLFKELGLPQANAQRIVDFHLSQIKAATEASSRAYDDMRASWQTAAKADAEIEPHMAKIKENAGPRSDG